MNRSCRKALRQAQLTTMKEFPEPFYWAAYELTGEP
jgi:CHAT domain-containing protein